MSRYKKSVNILGTQYKIKIKENYEDIALAGTTDGYCDETLHEIVVQDMERHKSHPQALGDLDSYQDRCLRHELIHAYLNESGLMTNSKWARDEEMVDWLAIMLPKIFKTFQELGILE